MFHLSKTLENRSLTTNNGKTIVYLKLMAEEGVQEHLESFILTVAMVPQEYTDANAIQLHNLICILCQYT